ncbi:CFEM domain-containing protein [Aspergillus undulatus]|uniref:CFEM domain-containing protein n=1 Tax=Aspergillus undulatus TaxID=1810928 RepID=UPI003CCD5CE1
MSHDGCSSLTDFACHCAKPVLVSEVTPCVEQACNEEDQASVSSAVVAECSSAGVPISIPAVGGSPPPTTESDPTATTEVTTSSDGLVSPSGPVMTLPTSTELVPMPSSTPVGSSSSVPVLPSHTGSLNATSSPPFLGGAETIHAEGLLAGAAVAIAAGYLV